MRLGLLIVTGLVLTANPARAGDASTLPEEREMQTFVTGLLKNLGLHNEVRVVIDPAATGCAYATTIAGEQYVGVDPACVGRLRTGGAYEWRAVGILAHEVGHLLSGHTTNQQPDDPATEAAADEWAGWALHQVGTSLYEAQTYARNMSVEASQTHPGRQVRLSSVERDWRTAQGQTAPGRLLSLIGGWLDAFTK
jgi:hypothetical protein